MPRVPRESVRHAQTLGVGEGIAIASPKRKRLDAGRFRRALQERQAIGDDGLVGFAGAIPFEHGEFRRMQRPALAIAEDAGEFEDAPLAGRQKLLAANSGEVCR